MKNPLKTLYDWVLSWAEKPGGNIALYSIAFAESSLFPYTSRSTSNSILPTQNQKKA